MTPTKKYTSPTQVNDPSYFITVADKKPQIQSWTSIVDKIRNDATIKQNTQIAREAFNNQQSYKYAEYKPLNGAITPASQCQGGHAASNIIQLTGITMVDLDHVPLEQMPTLLQIIRDDSHTFIAHTTCSGQGIRILAKYTATEPKIAYLDAWTHVNQYYRILTDFDYDRATKDATRLSYLCHDADCHYDPNSKPFIIDNTPRTNLPQPSSPNELIAQAEAILQKQGYQFAQGSRHAYIQNAAFLLNKMGVDQSDTIAHYQSLHDDPAEVARLVNWCYQKGTSEHGKWLNTMPNYETPQIAPTKAKKEPKPKEKKFASLEQVRQYIDQNLRIRRNLLTMQLEYQPDDHSPWQNLTDTTANTLWHDCSVALNIYVRKEDFHSELDTLYTEQFNPFLAYFDTLPEWQPTDPDYIAQLAATVHTSAPEGLFEECFRIWLVATVNNWIHPDETNQTILVFLGKQGIYKSTFFRLLLPPELHNYFLVKSYANRLSKDDRLALTQYLLVALEEIDSLRDVELNAIKAIVTTQVISERAAYDRNRSDRHHIASFCATGNNVQFLTDTTGNRRWLPFEVLDIDDPHTHPINYAGLYSQILYLIRNHFQHWFTNAQNEAMEAYKHRFTTPDIEEEMILRYFRAPQPGEIAQFHTTADVVAHLAENTKTKFEIQRIGKTLTRLFGKRINSGKQKGYLLYPIPYEERHDTQINQATETLKQLHTTNQKENNNEATIPTTKESNNEQPNPTPKKETNQPIPTTKESNNEATNPTPKKETNQPTQTTTATPKPTTTNAPHYQPPKSLQTTLLNPTQNTPNPYPTLAQLEQIDNPFLQP